MIFKYIFLDFDGVMHGNVYNYGKFAHAQMVTDRLLPFKDNFRVIISSSWREEYALDILKHAFNEPLTDNIIDITPILVHGMKYYGRYLEIIQYCQSHNISQDQWVALDDMAHLFPPNCPQLIITNSSTGITPKLLDKVELFVSQPYCALSK